MAKNIDHMDAPCRCRLAATSSPRLAPIAPSPTRSTAGSVGAKDGGASSGDNALRRRSSLQRRRHGAVDL